MFVDQYCFLPLSDVKGLEKLDLKAITSRLSDCFESSSYIYIYRTLDSVKPPLSVQRLC